MITKEQFHNLIETAIAFDSEIDRWDNFGINIFEFPISDHGWKFLEITLEICFQQPEIDTIYWWLFERDRNYDKPDFWNEDGKVVPTKTIDDLWNIVKDFRIND